jgi:hypothetical protein
MTEVESAEVESAAVEQSTSGGREGVRGQRAGTHCVGNRLLPQPDPSSNGAVRRRVA